LPKNALHFLNGSTLYGFSSSALLQKGVTGLRNGIRHAGGMPPYG